MNIVERIKELQLKKDGKISLNKLEKEMGFGKSTISSWSTKKPASDKLEKLADYFNVSVDYLLGREQKPAENEYIPEEVLDSEIIQMVNDLTPEELAQLEGFLKGLLAHRNI